MKIAAFQGAIPTSSEARLEKLQELSQLATDQAIEILCFPEGFLTGYYDDRQLAWENSFDLREQAFQTICQQLSHHTIW